MLGKSHNIDILSGNPAWAIASDVVFIIIAMVMIFIKMLAVWMVKKSGNDDHGHGGGDDDCMMLQGSDVRVSRLWSGFTENFTKQPFHRVLFFTPG